MTLTILLLATTAASAADPDPRLQRRDELVTEARHLQQEGDLAHAHEALSRVLALEEEIFGEVHEETFGTHSWLAGIEEDLGDFDAANRSLRRALEIRRHLSGPDHWKTTDARFALEALEFRAGLTSDERVRLQRADSESERCSDLYQEGRYEVALEPARVALALREEILGSEHRRTAESVNLLANVHYSLDESELARPLYERAYSIYESATGPLHPWPATILNNLANLYHYRTEEPEKALPLYERALSIRSEVLGPGHRDTLQSMESLRDLLVDRANDARDAGNLEDAIETGARVLDLEREFLGEVHEEVFDTCTWLAEMQEEVEDFDAARRDLQAALEIRREISGEDHWKTIDARLDLEELELRASVSPEERALLERAESENDRLVALYHEGRYAAAIEPAKAALGIRAKVLGPEHPSTATSLNDLAVLYWSMGEYGKALPLHERALAIREKVLGPEHPWTATSLNNLALLYKLMGEYGKALPLYERTLSIREKALGPEHPDTATSLDSLASLYMSMGEYGKALPLYERALSIDEKALGPEHPGTATDLNNLALLYKSMGEYGKALPLYERALSIDEMALGPEHPDTATSLNNLALLYESMGNSERALPLLERSLSIREKALGPEHPDTASSLNNLAGLYESMGEYEKALPLYERSLSILEKALGPEHPSTATGLGNLAVLHGEAGRLDLAFPLAVRALRARRAGMQALSLVLAERSQLRQFGDVTFSLDLCLSTGGAERAGTLHDAALTTKGLVFRRQAFLRAQRARPELSGLFSEYESVCRRLASLLLSTPEPEKAEAHRRRTRVLRNRQEELEADLAAKSEAFRAERDSRRLSSAELAACLPEGTVLLDLLSYDQLLPREAGVAGPTRWEKRYVAFVLRPDAATVRVDLGEAAAIDPLVEKWRAEVRAGGGASAGRRLRALVWEPLSPHVGNARTVLVSPDGALSRVPFAALPGPGEGIWLLDEYAFVTVPVPRLLPARLEGRADEAYQESLLLVGEVDYGAAAGAPGEGLVASARAAPRDGLRGEWEPLAATRSEVLAVRDSFELRFAEGETDSLRRKRATEEAFREAAGAHRWLHVATHGFFAPEEVKSALADAGRRDGARMGEDRPVVGFHPGLLSGIVLAGANRPPAGDGDDGILTALEIASLDFSGTELVVLSACETGLGEVAGGEGVLGLQRAFQMAGARSTLTSLWKVDDEFTRKLMTLFYEKLWGEGLPKAEALRQAQLALMRDKGMRGLAVKDESAGAASDRLPPLYWAGFTLSGDWR